MKKLLLGLISTITISNAQKMIGSRYMGYIKKVFVKLGDKVNEKTNYTIRK